MINITGQLKVKRLSLRLALFGSLIVFVGGLLGTGALITAQYLEAQQSLKERVEVILLSTEMSLVPALYNLDRETLDKIIQGVGAYPEITRANIHETSGLFDATYDAQQQLELGIIWKTFVNHISTQKLTFTRIINDPSDEENEIGRLTITVEPALVLIPALKQGVRFIAILAIINLLLLLALGLMTRHMVTQPLKEIGTWFTKFDISSPNQYQPLPDDKFKTLEFRLLLRITNQFLLALNQHLEDKSRYENSLLLAEKESRDAKMQLIDAIESIHDGFILMDHEQNIVMCNSKFLSFYPSAKKSVEYNSNFRTLLHGIAKYDLILHEPIERWVDERCENDFYHDLTYESTLRSGKQIKITSLKTTSGGIVSIHSDITELKIAEQELRYRADYDQLTGMYNRNKIIEYLQDVLCHSKREKKSTAVLFIDLDRFKNINDTLGHAFGDELLIQAGHRIQQTIRQSDVSARIGGDEFCVLLPDVKTSRSCAVVAQKLKMVLSEPFKIFSNDILISASIGISLYPNDSDDAYSLLQQADMAMYKAKQENRGTFKFFDQSMSQQAEMFVKLEQELAIAIRNEQFILNYQPITPIKHQLPHNGFQVPPEGIEVLIRWEHPERGLVPPDEFISVAEETGQIGAIGEWVLRTACQQAMDWIEEHPCYLAVNVSYSQFKKGFDSSIIRKILDETGFPANLLYLEITESLLIDDEQYMLDTLINIQKLGVKIVIDDFGTGYSSLSYLKKYPIYALKIDKSFVFDMENNLSSRQLVQTIVAMAKGMDIKVVAEGVETEQHAQYLSQLECDFAQGFYYARPLSKEDLLHYLNK